PDLARVAISSLAEDGAGTVWASGAILPSGRLCVIRSGNVTCHGDFGRWVSSLYENGGHLWVAADTGLWRWAPDAPRLYRLHEPIFSGPQALPTDDRGAPPRS